MAMERPTLRGSPGRPPGASLAALDRRDCPGGRDVPVPEKRGWQSGEGFGNPPGGRLLGKLPFGPRGGGGLVPWGTGCGVISHSGGGRVVAWRTGCGVVSHSSGGRVIPWRTGCGVISHSSGGRVVAWRTGCGVIAGPGHPGRVGGHWS